MSDCVGLKIVGELFVSTMLGQIVCKYHVRTKVSGNKNLKESLVSKIIFNW